MKRRVITTSDGSKTIQIEGWNEQYHSLHGAVQEARHVFIAQGLSLFTNRNIDILEIGFGTGLNTLVTLVHAEKLKLKIRYTGVEAYPVSEAELKQLNYISVLKAGDFESHFQKIHSCPWEKDTSITKNFILKKRLHDFMDIEDKNNFDLVYFDAFGARVQPELWTEIIFKKMFDAMRDSGILVTYSAKGSVRRAMQSVGFKVERLPGPPGKREMLRATKG